MKSSHHFSVWDISPNPASHPEAPEAPRHHQPPRSARRWARQLRTVERYLYRGVNAELYAITGGKLAPKATGQPFRRAVYFGEEVYFGDGSVYGEAETNAVLMHQRNSSKYPSSGVSTTPIFENAKKYATHNNQSGYVYKIDTHCLDAAGVKTYSVDEPAVQPVIPQDQEVIRVAADCGALPDEIVVEII